MMQIANILPGQWKQHLIYRYAVWANRLGRAVGAELKKLPERPPPLPWPVRPNGRDVVRQTNSGLFPKFPAKPKRRVHANTYVPHTIDLNRTRTEVYRPDQKDEDWLWRIKICWDDPHPGEIEAVVDRGGILYLPHFRQVTIRLPLKAKICRKLKANKHGEWVGECNGVKKLNAREQIASTTKWLLEKGQSIAVDNGKLTVDSEKKTAGRPDLSKTNHPQGRRPFPLLSQGGELGGRISPGVAAYHAKQMARERRAREAKLQRRLPLEGALHVEGFYPSREWGTVRYEPVWEKKRRIEQWEQDEQEELEAIGFILRQWERPYYGPSFQRDDAFDGYLLKRNEFGPDPWDFDWPEPRFCRYLNNKWRGRRKPKRYPTVRDRLGKVKPSLRIVPTGKRSAELVVTRRLHELSVGIGEALNLARMIEGAIKYRAPVNPNRKPSWRQTLRHTIVHRPGGLLRWLVLNPIDTMDSGPWTREAMGNGQWMVENEKRRKNEAGVNVLDLGPFDGEALRSAYPRRPELAELFPEARLPKDYLGLIDRNWLTEDGNLFAATPAGDFATSIEGFPVRLPVAVMPPAAYERWRAWGGHRRRRSRRGRSLRRCCYCPSSRAKSRASTVRQTVSLSRVRASAPCAGASP